MDFSILKNITQEVAHGSLTFIAPTTEDEGQYACYAENKYGTARTNLITIKRVFLENFKNDSVIETIEATEGDPFKLECKAPGGFPDPSIFWMIQTIQGAIKGIDNPRMTLDPAGNLWFSAVAREDASKDSCYVCSAASSVVNEYKLGNRIMLKVIPRTHKSPRLPKVQYVSPPTMFALRGNTVELFCIYHGTPLPKIAWSKNGKSIEYNERLVLENYGKSLRIKKADVEDEGRYACEVTSENAEGNTSNFELKIESPPRIIDEPMSNNVTLKQSFQIACKVNGSPEPIVHWFFNGKIIENSDKHRQVNENRIVVEEAKESDTGNYACIATNSYGYAFRDVYIIVEAV